MHNLFHHQMLIFESYIISGFFKNYNQKKNCRLNVKNKR
jgi:hypothetical protein